MPESQTDASAADEVLCAGDAVDIETALNHVSSSKTCLLGLSTHAFTKAALQLLSLQQHGAE
jgi:hypothetical protein